MHRPRFASLVAAIAMSLVACQRPAGVPDEVKSSTNVYGTSWNWCELTPNGRIWWSAFDDHMGLSLDTDPDCSSPDLTPKREGPIVSYNNEGRLRIDELGGPNPGAGEACRLRLSAQRATTMVGILDQVLDRTSDSLRRRMLMDAAARLRDLDQTTLVYDTGGGCVPSNWAHQ